MTSIGGTRPISIGGQSTRILNQHMIQRRQYTDDQRRFLTAYAAGLSESDITVYTINIDDDGVHLEYVTVDPADTDALTSEVQRIAGQFLGLARQAVWTPYALHATAHHPEYESEEWRVDAELTSAFVSGEVGIDAANERLAAAFGRFESDTED